MATSQLGKRSEPDEKGADDKASKKQTTAPPPPTRACMRALLEESRYYDAVLVCAGGEEVRVHRDVLGVVPFFDAAFRTGAQMREGKEGTSGEVRVRIVLGSSHSTTLYLVRYVYGYPNAECLPERVEDLLRVYEECEMFDYRPFLELLWARVGVLRREDNVLRVKERNKGTMETAKRVMTVEFACKRTLDVELHYSDTFYGACAAYTPEAIVYLAKAGKGASVVPSNDYYVMWLVAYYEAAHMVAAEANPTLRTLVDLCDATKVDMQEATMSDYAKLLRGAEYVATHPFTVGLVGRASLARVGRETAKPKLLLEGLVAGRVLSAMELLVVNEALRAHPAAMLGAATAIVSNLKARAAPK
jgi:hypothetical protein